MNFARTSCACTECVNCCKDQPGALALGDMERIAAHLGKTVAEVRPLFWASPGALVGNMLTGRRWRIGSITPRWNRHTKRCVFLDPEDRCTIHEVAPMGCALFDTHMGPEVAMPRSKWLAESQQHPDYQDLRSTLDFAERSKPRSY